MISLDDYQLVLFDFDGLLVNTERLHFKAYQLLLKEQGGELPWDFREYCTFAHKGATDLRDTLYRLFPELGEWGLLYERKCALYSGLVDQVDLMPGVERVLHSLKGKKHAVVTHSRLEHIDRIRAQHSILQAIPHWITREDYAKPKPDPECYITAIKRLAGDDEQVIGFEDTPRGIQALKGSRAQPVIVCPPDYPLLGEIGGGAFHIASFAEVNLNPIC